MTNADSSGGRIRRNKRVAIGVAGLAAVVGGGAFLLANQGSDQASEEPSSASAPQPSTSAPVSSGPAPVTTTTPTAEIRQVLPAPSGPLSLDERLDAARSANKRLGTEVRHPAPMPAVAVDESKVKVVQTGSPKERRTFKVASSRQDLTGYRELAWVRNGKPVGDATCTKSVTVSENVPARERPTLLICWRTSATRSAYTVAVDFDKPPAQAVSIAALEKAWAALR
ncbi:hypothetical protein [Paractinoplanes brasiliensis]|uniref:Uncharacterized protein n=1 Tax=Paractinoplanes brasiliensis TaxID=52695 RepID=A0A4R6JX44_9ACTN|nr:hypothetical protein [Actinoplanes brasiliensis]TDO41350.1 hypothetical protein C8E87_5082 [Actinoplanes brasiliensis]GID27367.1 hypothetical protein Abr02nite_23500 [Actinoplanes brasiliensis]